MADQNIEWFQITVNDSFGMDEKNTFQYLIRHVFDMVQAHLILVNSNNIHQILRAVFHIHINFIEVCAALRPHYRLQLHNLNIWQKERC